MSMASPIRAEASSYWFPGFQLTETTPFLDKRIARFEHGPGTPRGKSLGTSLRGNSRPVHNSRSWGASGRPSNWKNTGGVRIRVREISGDVAREGDAFEAL